MFLIRRYSNHTSGSSINPKRDPSRRRGVRAHRRGPGVRRRDRADQLDYQTVYVYQWR